MNSKRFSTETQTLVDFQVVNRIGTVVYSSNHAEVARKWASKNLSFHGELEVQEVTTTTTVNRRRIYRPHFKPVQPGWKGKGWVSPIAAGGAA